MSRHISVMPNESLTEPPARPLHVLRPVISYNYRKRKEKILLIADIFPPNRVYLSVIKTEKKKIS